MRLKGWNIKHAHWSSSTTFDEDAGLNRTAHQMKVGGGDRDKINVSMDGQVDHTAGQTGLHTAVWFCSMGQIKKLNATWSVIDLQQTTWEP